MWIQETTSLNPWISCWRYVRTGPYEFRGPAAERSAPTSLPACCWSWSSLFGRKVQLLLLCLEADENRRRFLKSHLSNFLLCIFFQCSGGWIWEGPCLVDEHESGHWIRITAIHRNDFSQNYKKVWNFDKQQICKEKKHIYHIFMWKTLELCTNSIIVKRVILSCQLFRKITEN